MAEYRFKTDRDSQWEKRKTKLKRLTRKELKELENYFYSGDITIPNKWGCQALLFLHPEQSINSWQETLLKRLNLDMYVGANSEFYSTMDELYEKILQSFLGYIGNYGFDPEDRAWIFKQIFGECYDPERVFPLRLSGETECRKITFGADKILSSLMLGVYNYLEEDESYPYAFYLQGYISTILPYINKEAFGVEEPGDREKYLMVYYGLNKIIEFACKDKGEGNEEELKKIELACQMKSIFDNYDGDLGGYDELVRFVEKEGSLV